MDTGHLGKDIFFQNRFQTSGTGDTATLEGRACLAQDLRHALTTPKGDLWYAPSYGIDIYKYLHNENTEVNRLSLELEVVLTMEADPRVAVGSGQARVVSWDLHSAKIEASCQPADGSNRLNMVLGYTPNAFEAEVGSL